MDDELVVAVLVEAFQAGAVAPHTVHARRGIAGELDPFRLERMELRVDDGTRKRNRVRCRAVKSAGSEASIAAPRL